MCSSLFFLEHADPVPFLPSVVPSKTRGVFIPIIFDARVYEEVSDGHTIARNANVITNTNAGIMAFTLELMTLSNAYLEHNVRVRETIAHTHHFTSLAIGVSARTAPVTVTREENP